MGGKLLRSRRILALGRIGVVHGLALHHWLHLQFGILPVGRIVSAHSLLVLGNGPFCAFPISENS